MISVYASAALLNHFNNGNAMPSIPTLYTGLHSGIPASDTGIVPEVSLSAWTNYKRAGTPRSTTGYPLITTGRVGSNATAIVKAGNQFTFASSIPGVVWALLNAPSGTIINQNGTVTTGATGGRGEVAIYPSGSVPSMTTPLAKAILYVDKEP